MPDLWRPDDDETKQLTDKRAKNLLDLLRDRKQTDEPWVSLFTVQIELSIDEFTAVGILIYLWLQDKVWVSRGTTGDLLLMYPYEPVQEAPT